MMKEVRFVLFIDSNGTHPALVTQEYKKQEGQKEPDLALAVFVPRQHLPCYSVDRVSYKREKGGYIFEEDVEEEKPVVVAPPKVVNFEPGQVVTLKEKEEKPAKPAKEKKTKEEAKEESKPAQPAAPEDGKAEQTDTAPGKEKSQPSA